MKTFEVGDFGLVTGFRERFESGFDQRTDATTEYGLFTEQVGFRFFGKGGFKNTGAGAADAASIGKSERLGFPGCVLLDGKKAGCTAAFGENFAHPVAGGFRRDHGYVNGGGRLDGAEANVEAVCKHQRFARFEVWRDGFVVEFLLLGVRNENHDDVGPCGGLRRRLHGEAVFFSFGAGGAGFRQADANIATAVTEVEGMSVSLRAVA